jgi:hypothetical protein
MIHICERLIFILPFIGSIKYSQQIIVYKIEIKNIKN